MSNTIKSPKTTKSKTTKTVARPTLSKGVVAADSRLAKAEGEAPPRASASVALVGEGTAPAETPRTVMSAIELAQLGGGTVAYIKVMTHDEARRMFPAVEALPQGINLYALHAADGTPLALTDSRQAAIGQAMGNELAVASVH